MFVDVELLHSGANESHYAGEHAHGGADQLSRGPLLSGMFGTFPVAQTFHDAVGAAHAQQMRNLHAHRQALITVGEKARHAATGFTGMDDGNAAELKAVVCSCAT